MAKFKDISKIVEINGKDYTILIDGDNINSQVSKGEKSVCKITIPLILKDSNNNIIDKREIVNFVKLNVG